MSVYYNVRIDGNENGTINSDGTEQPAEYRVSRNSPFIANQSNYEVGIVRFCIPSTTIPKYDLDLSSETGKEHRVGLDFAYKSPPTTYTNPSLGTTATEGKRNYGGLVKLDGESTTIDQLIHSYQNTNNTYNSSIHLTTLNRNNVYLMNSCENKNIACDNELNVISAINSGLRGAFYEQTQNFNEVYYQEGASNLNTSFDGGTIENHSFGNNAGANITAFTLQKVDAGGGNNINTISHTCEDFVDTKCSGYYLLLSNVECDTGGNLHNLEIEIDYVFNGKTITNTLIQGLNNATKLANNLIFSNCVPQSAEDVINSGIINYGTDYRTIINGDATIKKNYF
jgi:hypothetical protein